MRTAHFTFDTGVATIREKLLGFASRESYCAFLDSHSDSGSTVPVTGVRYDLLAAFGAKSVFSSDHNGLEQLERYLEDGKNNWFFGHLGYDLKNGIERLSSRHPDRLGFAEMVFFIPETVVTVKGNRVTVVSDDAETIWSQIIATETDPVPVSPSLQLRHRLTRDEYLEAVAKTIQHILRGDIYEMNYCHEFYAEDAEVEPLSLAKALFSVSPNPFSCYYRNVDSHLICASPERFLMREGTRLLSQPIKGTAPRDKNPVTDAALRERLGNDEKEKAENVMIVDLVRNDMARFAARGSVKVEELFQVCTFPGAHQMISTISCEIPPKTTFTDIIRATFPMGSMTGAPKIRAMEIADELEHMRRGLFSGSVGYIEPGGNFDFNVVIRNIQYNAYNRYLSVMAGGAITAASSPVKEYEETLVKLAPQLRVLGHSQHEQNPSHA